MVLTQQSPKAIKIGKPTTSSTQGPCDSGFHIMGGNEISQIGDIFIALGLSTLDSYVDYTNGTNFKNYLKMPLAGNIDYSSGTVSDVGSVGYYWTSQIFNDIDPRDGTSVNITLGTLLSIDALVRGYGMNIRPVKNEGVAKDSNWTTIYSGQGGAGIFHNASLGLITLSGDGTNWITIADKNLGATTVYNSGDTLSQANCGNYYQRGNNYGFPFNGSVTTSSTQVDASNYGPGNYYSSNVFITSWNWDSSFNANIWGGVDTPIKKVYLGSTQVRPKPILLNYLIIGGGGGGGNYHIAHGGGGGGGGFIYKTSQAIQTGSYNVVVGTGGNAATTTNGRGADGGNSSLFGDTAYGGGGGGGGGVLNTGNRGGSGGGGGGGGTSAATGGNGITGQGYKGGTQYFEGTYFEAGGGGGGAGAIGSNGYDGGSNNFYGGKGGNGKPCDITGTSTNYSAGGGGGGKYGGNGGNSGGGKGAGSSTSTAGGNGTYYGGGGGGGGSYYAPGNGYQGVVIVSYLTASGYNITGGTITTSGNYTIHTFTSDGTLTVN